MRKPVLLATLALVAVVGGCAGQSGEPGPPGGMSVPPTGHGSGDGSGGPPPLPEVSPPATPSLTPIDPVAGTRDRTVRWRLAGQAEGGRVLLLDAPVGGPPCDAVTGIDIRESAAEVKIIVYAGKTGSASCPPGVPAILGTTRVRAVLTQPLGQRRAVDTGS
jgi:hypothetical protein